MQTIQRENQLKELGFVKCGHGWGYPEENIYVGAYQITQLIEPSWDNLIENLILKLAKIKPKLPIDTNITEFQKMELFNKSLGQITGPEIADPELIYILTGVLERLHDARKYMIFGLQNYKSTFKSASNGK